MEPTILLSADSLRTAGILMLALVTIESGGFYLLRLHADGGRATPFQFAFARAGHAHAGVLVTLGLVCQMLADAAGLTGGVGLVARSAIPAAAILMPAGFFFSSMRRGATAPNRWIHLVHAGAVSLAAGAVALGIGLLQVAPSA